MERIVLGIDPGTLLVGYGIISVQGSKHCMIEMKALNLRAIKEPVERLQKIFDETERIVKHFSVAEIAIEEPFYGKNIQSMLKLGRAQGVAIAAGLQHHIPIFTYTPRKIKQSITGNGAASKQQVAAMLQKMLFFSEIPRWLDATDGLAVALCHCYQGRQSLIPREKFNSWQSFINQNPERIGEQKKD